MIAQHATPLRVDEDAIYAALNYAVGDPLERATHGTKVMGIAAGMPGAIGAGDAERPRGEFDIAGIRLGPQPPQE